VRLPPVVPQSKIRLPSRGRIVTEPAWNALAEGVLYRGGLPATVNGDRFRVTYRYGARYSKTGYEPHVHEAFTTQIREGDVVLDVGAHIGLFTLAAALRTGPSGSVRAFEPAPENRRLLERHVAMNGWRDRVTVEAAVVAAREGEARFFTNGETMAAALFRENIERLARQRFAAPTEELVVEAVTLDGYCATHRLRPDKVKIDVEGAELEVLRGASEVASTAQMLIEVHPDQLAYFGDSVAQLESFLDERGRDVQIVGEPNDMGIYHVLVT
jgi:FkbM family methyltransferase